jgi:hypothetical protein
MNRNLFLIRQLNLITDQINNKCTYYLKINININYLYFKNSTKYLIVLFRYDT